MRIPSPCSRTLAHALVMMELQPLVPQLQKHRSSNAVVRIQMVDLAGSESEIAKDGSILMLLKLSSMRDLNMVMADYNLGLTKEEVKSIYKDATQRSGDFLKIDPNTADNNKRYSRNWTDFYRVET